MDGGLVELEINEARGCWGLDVERVGGVEEGLGGSCR